MEWIYPALLIGLPLGGPMVCVASSRSGWKGAPYIITVAMLAASTLVSLMVTSHILAEGPVLLAFPEGYSPSLSVNIDSFGAIMVLLGTSLCLACALVSRSYGQLESHNVRYLSSILILCSSLNGIFLSGDLLLMMVFWELMVVSSYLLIIQSGSDSAFAAGRKYFIMAQSGAILLIISVVVAISQTGTSRMMPGSAFSSSTGRLIFAALAFTGFGIDAAVVPLHIWLPDAHSESPTPMSALLSGIVVKTGLYGITRFFYIVYATPSGWSSIVVPLGLVTALVGGFLAVFQMDGKRLIAMSTISQVGLIVMGLGSGVFSGVTGAVYHLLNHSLFKSLLFLSAGWVMWKAGTRDLRSIASNGQASSHWILPFYVVGLLSISGIPPFNGFFSKSIIAKAVSGTHPLLAMLSTLVGMLTLLSFMKLGWYLFLRRDRTTEGTEATAPVAVLVVCASLASLCLIQGILASPIVAAIDGALQVPKDQLTMVTSILEPSLLTMIGYLGVLAALLIWTKKELVYELFTEGSLRGVGCLASRELYVDAVFASGARLVQKASGLVAQSTTGNARDYMVYITVAWLAGLLLILGGVL